MKSLHVQLEQHYRQARDGIESRQYQIIWLLAQGKKTEELGLWQGRYLNQTQQWLQWWDEQGNLLLIGDERAQLEHARAEQEKQRAEQERQRAENVEQARRDAIPRLLAMGLTVEQVAEALSLSVEAVRQASTEV
jgi:DNA-binding NarL/FixJ family response regulator